jgi:hypothetical protein
MNLTEFESYVDTQFAHHLPAVAEAADESKSEALIKVLFARLEQTALTEGVEVCQRMSWLLVLALYEMHLSEYAASPWSTSTPQLPA